MLDKIVIDTDSIQSFSNNIKIKSKEIMDILLDIEKDFVDIEGKYNSKSGKLYREKITDYINYAKNKVTSDNESLTSKINTIVKIYEDTGKEIEKMVS